MDPQVDVSLPETVATPLSSISSPSISEEGRFLPGTVLGGRYRVIGLLGRGGMGEVYRAADLMLGQSVALKLLPQEAGRNEALLERFRGEVRTARLIAHPNVCRVFDIGELDGAPFISMEYVNGEDLASLLLRIGRMPANKAVEIARKLCAGLAAAHSRGVIHRDLKPQNIMIDKRGEPVIMDFGLAAVGAELSGPEARNGTPAYMAPEQLKGGVVTLKSDLYALGLVLYELFTGKRPFEAQTMQRLIEQQEAAQVTSISSIAADIEPAVEKTIRRCLSPDPANRPASAMSVLSMLPGGDPLAAALAAGETPSPEVVASAGRTDGLAVKYSALCLVLIVASLFGSGILRDRQSSLMQTQLDYSPEVLKQKSREIATMFGYTKRPADSVLWLGNRFDLLRELGKLPAPRKWDHWLSAEAPVQSFYREAPFPLFAYPFGVVNEENPPPLRPGMVNVRLDGRGRLLRFAAQPYREGQGTTPAVSPESVFRTAGLDISAFKEVTASMPPASAADQVHAWSGPYAAIPGLNVTVQIASWKNWITQVNVDYWCAASAAAGPPSNFPRIVEYFSLALLALASLFIPLMVVRNWKLGRADRRGARRLGIARFLLALLVYTGTVHFVRTERWTDTTSMLVVILGDCLVSGIIVWLMYLALEPELRARWPQAIVTWNRLLAGRWLDAQVGAHILIGATVGSVMWTGFKALALLFGLESSPYAQGGLDLTLGVRHWVAGHAVALAASLILGLCAFMTVFGFRQFLRKDLYAALAAAFLFTCTEDTVLNAANWEVVAALYIAIYAVLVFVLLRFGLVATLSAIFFVHGFDSMTLGTDWSAWYASAGAATLFLLLAIAVFAFWRSLGSRDLLSPEPTG